MDKSLIFAYIIVLLAVADYIARAFNTNIAYDISKFDKDSKTKPWISRTLNGALGVALLGSLYLFHKSCNKESVCFKK